MDAAILTQVVLPAALFCIMAGVGLSLKFASFRRILVQPRLILLGLGLQMICLPLLALLLVQLFQLPAALAAGLLIVALAPGGATSNMITFLIRGDTALSVSLTGLTSLLTPLSLPLLTVVFVAPWVPDIDLSQFPVLATMFKLLAIALLPVVLGMLVQHYAPEFSQRMIRPVKVMAVLFLLIVVVGIVGANYQKLLVTISLVGPVALLLMILALAGGYFLTRSLGFPQAQALTLGVETGIQNAGTALLVTAGVLQSPEMSVAALCYGVVMNLPVMVLIIARNWAGYRLARA